MESCEKEILMPLEKKDEIRKLTEEIIDIKDNTIINQSSCCDYSFLLKAVNIIASVYWDQLVYQFLQIYWQQERPTYSCMHLHNAIKLISYLFA